MSSKNERHSLGEHGRDTLCPDLCQSLYFTWAAGQRLGHHEEKVGVFYPLGMEQPTAETVMDI